MMKQRGAKLFKFPLFEVLLNGKREFHFGWFIGIFSAPRVQILGFLVSHRMGLLLLGKLPSGGTQAKTGLSRRNLPISIFRSEN